jgi:hypothetical protein
MDNIIYSVGLAACVALALGALLALIFGAIWVWMKWGPKLRYGTPETIVLLGAYRPNVRTAQSELIKVAPDLNVRWGLGFTWKLWAVGIVHFESFEEDT